jgi:hypothetical protein
MWVKMLDTERVVVGALAEEVLWGLVLTRRQTLVRRLNNE